MFKLGVFLAAAGLCKAILPALKNNIKGTQASMLDMLHHFAKSLSDRSHPQAMGVLLSGGLLEITMAHMANAGPDEVLCGTSLFQQMSRHPWGQEGMSKKGMVDQMIHCFAKWLSEVRYALANWVRCQPFGEGQGSEGGERGRRH
jgi:hypothetical protein